MKSSDLLDELEKYNKDLRCCANCRHVNYLCSFCMNKKQNIDATGVCSEWVYDSFDQYDREYFFNEFGKENYDNKAD